MSEKTTCVIVGGGPARFPQLSAIPAYLIGVGVRPGHAPAFARRAARAVPDTCVSSVAIQTDCPVHSRYATVGGRDELRAVFDRYAPVFQIEKAVSEPHTELREPYWVCAIYLVLLAVVGIAAALFMDNLDHRIEVGNYWAILSERHTWAISLLYIGTFGSFIGFSFAFGRVLYVNFLAGGQSAAQASLHVAQIAFLGPLLGSLSRIYGGRLADRIGGSRVTFVAFAGMTGAAGLLVGISTFDGHNHRGASGPAMIGYIVGFIALFIFSGIGNGSVFKMIPSIFEARSQLLAAGSRMSEVERRHWARAMSGALIGFAGAVGVLGGVGINMTLRQSYESTGQETPAFWTFLGFYLVAAALTWVVYVRRPTPVAGVSSPATASAHTRG